MFTPISIDVFVETYIKDNPDDNRNEIEAALTQAVEAKKNGTSCMICEQPIWSIGTALAGWNGCFSCITGEPDNFEDYEFDSVCF